MQGFGKHWFGAEKRGIWSRDAYFLLHKKSENPFKSIPCGTLENRINTLTIICNKAHILSIYLQNAQFLGKSACLHGDERTSDSGRRTRLPSVITNLVHFGPVRGILGFSLCLASRGRLPEKHTDPPQARCHRSTVLPGSSVTVAAKGPVSYEMRLR